MTFQECNIALFGRFLTFLEIIKNFRMNFHKFPFEITKQNYIFNEKIKNFIYLLLFSTNQLRSIKNNTNFLHFLTTQTIVTHHIHEQTTTKQLNKILFHFLTNRMSTWQERSQFDFDAWWLVDLSPN